MKILIDPEWADLAEDLSTEEKAELLMCILDYPNKECSLGLWRFIKKQLDKDAEKYKEKCARLKENAQYRWQEKSDMKSITKSDTKSDTISDTKSLPIAIADSIAKADSIARADSNTFLKKEKEKEKEKKAVNNLIRQFSKEHSFNAENKFDITYDFSFTKMMERNSIYVPYFSPYPLEVLKKTENSLIQKKYGYKLTMKQLIAWLEQSLKFYNQNNGGNNEL